MLSCIYSDYVEVGDYYYGDGTWDSPKLNINKQPIGIVFRNSPGGVDEFADKPENYGGRLESVHVYVMALRNATDKAGKWGNGGNGNKYAIPGVPLAPTSPTLLSDYTGYNYTKSIEEWGKENDYTATKAAIEYDMQVKDPGSSSGWYLPSIAQLSDIANMPNRAEILKEPLGKDFLDVPAGSHARYWSCTLPLYANAYVYQFDSNSVSNKKEQYKLSGCFACASCIDFRNKKSYD